MLNHTWGDNFRGDVNDRCHHTAGFNGGRNHTAGINALKTYSFPLAAEALKKPPGHSVLRADYGSFGTEHGAKLGRKLGQTVGLHAEDNNINGPDFPQSASYFRFRNEIAVSTLHLNAAFLHSAQVGSAREECDIQASMRHASADVGSDGAGSGDQEFHPSSSSRAAATARRRILPVAVVGIFSTK